MKFKTTSHAATAVLAGLAISIPAAHAGANPPVPSTNSAASFINWHQGFEHGTDGWYDASTEGPLGWCGAIQQVTPDNRGQAGLKPSAGRSFATVEFGVSALGGCNKFWTIALEELLQSAPYGPGPDLALYSETWPQAGYVTELDIYLDPAWSGKYSGNFTFAGDSRDTIVQFGATVFPRDYMPGDVHTGPHYFVNVDSGNGALVVAGHEITSAGWYTFRFIFSDDDGKVRVDFELDDTKGGQLARSEAVGPVDLWGPVKQPFPSPPLHDSPPELLTSEYGSGHVWFFDIAFGLQLPIDEHRVRRGR